jgi:hypothetical protein
VPECHGNLHLALGLANAQVRPASGRVSQR